MRQGGFSNQFRCGQHATVLSVIFRMTRKSSTKSSQTQVWGGCESGSAGRSPPTRLAIKGATTDQRPGKERGVLPFPRGAVAPDKPNTLTDFRRGVLPMV